jgi:hypothetical protein
LSANFLLSFFRKTKYRFGNLLRAASAPWLEASISPNAATSIFGCCFGDDGWHHLRQTLKEYDENPKREIKETAMWKFLKNFCPNGISVFANIEYQDPLPLFVYPWIDLSNLGEKPKDPKSSRFCGPSSDEFVRKEYLRTISLYKKIKSQGYKPSHYPHSLISGTFLISRSGKMRFIVMQGNHRMAVLAHLGYSEILVRANTGTIPFVDERKIKTWPNVRNGRCSVEHAGEVFNYFFKKNGSEMSQLSN